MGRILGTEERSRGHKKAIEGMGRTGSMGRIQREWEKGLSMLGNTLFVL